ncbi:hypothetical protein DFS33DRAFT_1351816 [Desarmillaria ectypa]|nr:hypothetical protein DFS33DRAFT_1351816 [Desarmillaria ectypa]
MLTRAQGMPESVLEQIQKMIRDFVWDNQGPAPVNMTILAAEIDVGGMKILDIEMMNQAIEVMRLKSTATQGNGKHLPAEPECERPAQFTAPQAHSKHASDCKRLRCEAVSGQINRRDTDRKCVNVGAGRTVSIMIVTMTGHKRGVRIRTNAQEWRRVS